MLLPIANVLPPLPHRLSHPETLNLGELGIGGYIRRDQQQRATPGATPLLSEGEVPSTPRAFVAPRTVFHGHLPGARSLSGPKRSSPKGSPDLSLSRKARSASPLSIFEPFNSPISKSRPLSWLRRRLLLNAKSALSRMDLRSRLHSVSGTKSGHFRTPCRNAEPAYSYLSDSMGSTRIARRVGK